MVDLSQVKCVVVEEVGWIILGEAVEVINMLLATSLSRLALVGCLLAIITALILPRKHNLASILQDILPETFLLQLTEPTSATSINDQQLAAQKTGRPQDIISGAGEPAALGYSKHTLRSRRQQQQQQPTSGGSTSSRRKLPPSSPAYFVPTPESSFHSAPASLSLLGSRDQLLAGADGFGVAGQRLAPATGQPAATSLTVFTVTVLALILYAGMRMLITRSGQRSRPQPTKGYPASGKQSHFCESHPPLGMHNNNHTSEPDIQWPTRTKLHTRLSRDERTRQLILHHGPKNVSQAIRFLTAELEKQRHELLAINRRNSSGGQSNDTLSPPSPCFCSCSCHHSTSAIEPGLPPTTSATSDVTTWADSRSRLSRSR